MIMRGIGRESTEGSVRRGWEGKKGGRAWEAG